MPHQLNRRRFIGQTTLGTIASGFFINPVSGSEAKSPNEKLNLAIVGVANKGGHNVSELASQNITALCDIDANYLAKAAEKYPKARQYRDYRKMLEAEVHRVDAVVVSTADHTHAPATAMALDLDKHVYCEKPLTHTVQEARVVAELARRKKRATQMGIQIHAGNNYRRVVELVRRGAIGRVTEVYNWCSKGWANGRFKPWDQPVPSHIDWDLWLGPAEKRPYSPSIHPGNWRRFWQYGAGTFGDMACHVMDLPFWALDLRHPTSIVCEGPEVHPDGAPDQVKATYEFPARGNRQAIKFHWSDGGAHFDLVKATAGYDGKPLSSRGLGILFVGEEGMLFADYGRWELLPQEKFADFEPPQPTIINSIGHWREWIEACKTGSPTTCNFDYAGALTETVLLGIVAFRTGQRIEWDAKNLQVTNTPNAEPYLKKKYRKGWEVVGIG